MAASPNPPPRFEPHVHVEGALLRPTLLEQLWSAPPQSARLAVLCAPAGFGKTTLLAQCADQARLRGWAVAWLNCDPRHRDSSLLGEDLAAALAHAHEVESGAGPEGRSAVRPDEEGTPLLICIDEFEAASCAAVDQWLEALVENLAPDVRVMLANRETPGPVLTRLQLAGHARVIDAQALRFTPEEALRLLAGAMPAEAARQVADYADGWPFALQLARLRAETGKPVERVWGPDARGRIPRRQIFDYLAEEVLAALDPEVAAFLRDVAILDVVDARLADAVRERSDGQQMLHRLLRLRPIVSIDEDTWQARLHPLLRDFMIELAAAGDTARQALLRQRAAQALAQRGQWHRAVGHAVAAGRIDLAAYIVQDAGGIRLVATEGAVRSRALLAQIPEPFTRQRPRLRLLKLATEIVESSRSDAELEFQRVERSLADEGHDGEAAVDLELARCVLMIHRAERELWCAPWSTVVEARRLARTLAADDARTMALILPIELFFLHRHGPAERAERRSREVERLHEQGAYTYNSPWLWVYRARNAMAKGRLADAERELVDSLGQDLNYTQFRQDSLGQLVHALLVRTAWQRSDLDAVARHVSALQAEKEMPLLEVLAAAHVDAARLEHALGNTSRAMEQLEAARQHADDEELALLGMLAATVQVELACRSGRADVGATTASAIGLADAWARAVVPHALPWLLVEAVAAASFQLHLATGLLDEARAVAERLRELARVVGEQLGELQALCLTISAADPLRPPLTLIGRVLGQSLETGAIRPLIDAGPPMMTALRAWLAETPPADSVPLRSHAAALLASWEEDFRRRSKSASASGLTRRELDVLAALVVEPSTKLVARRLSLSPETVKHHLKNIFSKLGVRTRDEAVAEARKRSLMA